MKAAQPLYQSRGFAAPLAHSAGELESVFLSLTVGDTNTVNLSCDVTENDLHLPDDTELQNILDESFEESAVECAKHSFD